MKRRKTFTLIRAEKLIKEVPIIAFIAITRIIRMLLVDLVLSFAVFANRDFRRGVWRSPVCSIGV